MEKERRTGQCRSPKKFSLAQSCSDGCARFFKDVANMGKQIDFFKGARSGLAGFATDNRIVIENFDAAVQSPNKGMIDESLKRDPLETCLESPVAHYTLLVSRQGFGCNYCFGLPNICSGLVVSPPVPGKSGYL